MKPFSKRMPRLGTENAFSVIGKAKKFEQEVPVYGTARTEFAQRSAPVNQSQVLQAMSGKLEDTLTGGERARPFMNALGQGEQALLKKATGYPRYTELSDVLTPQQMNVVNNVGGELKRDAVIAEQAQKGASAMQDIMALARERKGLERDLARWAAEIRDLVGSLPRPNGAQSEATARLVDLQDLNAKDLKGAMKQIEGTAKSMGLEIRP
jgi:hypothetical protein